MNPLLISGGLGGIGGLVIAGTVGWFLVSGANAERDAAIKSEKLALTSAQQWKDASSDRDKTIIDLNDQIKNITTAAQDTQKAALQLIDEANDRASATERQLSKFRSQANAALETDKPKSLSPSARSALEWLHCRAKTPADPTACQN